MAFTPDGGRLYFPDVMLQGVPVVNALSHEIDAVVEDAFERPYTCGHFVAEHRERIAGRVTADGAGVQGVEVTLSGGSFDRGFTTDAQGRYFFYAPAGRYTLSFARGGALFSGQDLEAIVADRGVTVADTEVLLAARIRVEPEIVNSGGSAVLHWDTLHAAQVSIDHGIGAVGASGSLAVSPAGTTVYTITAADSLGRTVSDQAVVTVLRPPAVSLARNQPR